MRFSALEPAIIAFFVTLVSLCCLLHIRAFNSVLDRPNDRSLHTQPVPRTGGVAIMAGVLAAWGIEWTHWLLPTLTSAMILLFVSFLDDVYGLSARVRFVIQFLVAVFFVSRVVPLESGLFLVILLAMAVVWMTNLFNFMDGSDGLAGGMALFGFGSYAVAAGISGHVLMATASMSIVAASIAFLFFNFHPAQIFMGDAGSIPLGFMVAAFGLLGWRESIWPFWFPLLVFSPFIVDSTVTLIKRLAQKERFWQAHRSHYYQRLVQMGWGHKNTALVEYLLMASVGVTAICIKEFPLIWQLSGLICWGCIYFILARVLDIRWMRYIQKSES